MAIKREGHSKSAAWSQINQRRYHVHLDDPVTGTHHQVRVVITDDLPAGTSKRLFDRPAVRQYIDRIDLRRQVISVQELTSVDVEISVPAEASADDLHERRLVNDRRKHRG